MWCVERDQRAREGFREFNAGEMWNKYARIAMFCGCVYNVSVRT
jgi:hypothetical protein